MKNIKEISRLEKDIYAICKKLIQNIEKGEKKSIERNKEYWELVRL